MPSNAEKAKAREALNSLFQQLNIKRVVCIDDEYAQPHIEAVLLCCGNLGVEHCRTKPTLKKLRKVDFDAPENGWRDQLRQAWDEMPEEQQRKILREVCIEAGDEVAIDQTALVMLKQLLEGIEGCEFKELSPTEWQRDKGSFLSPPEMIENRAANGQSGELKGNGTTEAPNAEEAGKVLLLFDLDLRMDRGTPTGGLDLIRDVNARTDSPDVICGMLSHKFTIEQEFDAWKRFAEENKIDPEKCVLVSKYRLGDEPVSFARAVKLTVLNVPSTKLRKCASTIMKQAQARAQASVDAINIYDFEHMVFESSRKEGVWEPDTLFRLFSLYQQIEARKLAKTDTEIQRYTEQIRAVSNIATSSKQVPQHSSWVIRRLELYESSDYINGFHMPIELGDIFRRTPDGPTLILIGQSCDLSVRSEGIRNKNIVEVTLAELVDTPSKQRLEFELPYFDETNGKSCYVDFKKAHTVKLWILDLCVYNADGVAELRLDASCPDMVIPAWRERWGILKEQLEADYSQYKATSELINNTTPGPAEATANGELRLAALSSSNDALLTEAVELTDRKVSYNLKRVERLCKSHAEALLRAYTNFLSRPAFDHNFAQEES